MFVVVTELQKEKRKLESKGDLKEVATVCNKIGELLSRLGMLFVFLTLKMTGYSQCRARLKFGVVSLWVS